MTSVEKRLFIGTNLKMYKTIRETLDFLKDLKKHTEDISRSEMELFVIPSFTTLSDAVKLAGEAVKIGAQNMHPEPEGQFTGEISPVMLKEIGIQIIEIGHSERRHVFNETDYFLNQKVLSALKYDFTPLLCIGETMEQKNSGISDEVLSMQLKQGLMSLSCEDAKKLWVAYEPVWAIGVNGIPASKEYADGKHAVIKDTISSLFGEETATQIPVLYGGSVNNENALDLINMPNIDGLFIGRGAWNADNFYRIIQEVLPAFKAKQQ